MNRIHTTTGDPAWWSVRREGHANAAHVQFVAGESRETAETLAMTPAEALRMSAGLVDAATMAMTGGTQTVMDDRLRWTATPGERGLDLTLRIADVRPVATVTLRMDVASVLTAARDLADEAQIVLMEIWATLQNARAA